MGTFIVQSITKGAKIYLDDKLIGRVPMTKPRRLLPGVHTIRMAKGGYSDYLDTFRVRRGKRTTLSIDLLAMMGILSVRTSPPGAMVLVDGEPLGRAPLETEVSPGRRVLRVRAPGYDTHEQRLEVAAGEQYPVEVALVPVAAPLGLEGDSWYVNPWVWVGVGVATLVIGGLTAAALTADEAVPQPLLVLRIETLR